MKTIKLLIIAAVTLMLAACNTNQPETPLKRTSGKIVGVIGCFDVKDERTPDSYRKGVVIETADKDSLLSFTMDIKEFDLPFRYGTLSIVAVDIPYEFYYQEINQTDKEYVTIAPITEDAMHQPCPIPVKQVKITPSK